jgi:DNA-binding NtrC family response regulator
VLIVEDQTRVARAIALLLELHGMPSVAVESPGEALAAVSGGGVDLVIQDMNFTPGESSGEEGIALFRAVRERDPGLPVLLVTAWPSLETAVRLVKEGAADYVEKPWDDDRLLASVRNLLRVRELDRENRRLRADRRRARDELAARYDLRGLVYGSDAMHGVVSLAVRVAASDVAVLLTGPSGTGKEHLSEVIHANSRRRSRPFVRVNAGGLPDTLLEAELFGAEPGAYTGADSRRIGRFEAADGGTLLLDEIGNLSPSGQARLLRVLQSGEYQRLGSSQTRRADVRILAATNADLQGALAAGTFREDLLFRLNVVEIEVPPLAGRGDDIRALAAHFLERFGAGGKGAVGFSEAAWHALLEHRWPGNVRELQNRVQRAIVVVDGEEITPADLDLPVAGSVPSPGPDEAAVGDDDEKRRIEAALLDCGGVIARAADVLGVSRQALYRRMERLGITVERRLRS